MSKEPTREEWQEYTRGLVETRFKAVEARFFSVQKTLDIICSDLDKDRADLSNFRVALNKVSSQMEEMIKVIALQSRQMASQVGDRMDEAVGMIADRIVETVQPVVENTLDGFTAGKPRMSKKQSLFERFKNAILKMIWKV